MNIAEAIAAVADEADQNSQVEDTQEDAEFGLQVFETLDSETGDVWQITVSFKRVRTGS